MIEFIVGAVTGGIITFAAGAGMMLVAVLSEPKWKGK